MAEIYGEGRSTTLRGGPTAKASRTPWLLIAILAVVILAVIIAFMR